MGSINDAIIGIADDYDIENVEALVAYATYLNGVDFELSELIDAASRFDEAFQGVYSSLMDFVQSYLEDVEPRLMQSLRDNYLRFEIDEIAWEQDYYFDEETGYVFFLHV